MPFQRKLVFVASLMGSLLAFAGGHEGNIDLHAQAKPRMSESEASEMGDRFVGRDWRGPAAVQLVKAYAIGKLLEDDVEKLGTRLVNQDWKGPIAARLAVVVASGKLK